MPDGQRGRPKTQTAFSDMVVGDDEELANELRIYNQNEATEEESKKRSARLKAGKRIRSILYERHRGILATFYPKDKDDPDAPHGWMLDGKEVAWIQVRNPNGDIVGYLTPKLEHLEEASKTVVFNKGGVDKVQFSFQKSPSVPAGSVPPDEDD